MSLISIETPPGEQSHVSHDGIRCQPGRLLMIEILEEEAMFKNRIRVVSFVELAFGPSSARVSLVTSAEICDCREQR